MVTLTSSSTPVPVPVAVWLPLLPVIDSSSTSSFHSTYSHHDARLSTTTTLNYPLPTTCCSIEALRDGMFPLYFHSAGQQPRGRSSSSSSSRRRATATISGSPAEESSRKKRKTNFDDTIEEEEGRNVHCGQTPLSSTNIQILAAKSNQLMEIVNLHRANLPLSFPPTFFLPLLLNDDFIVLNAIATSNDDKRSVDVNNKGKIVACISAHIDRQRGSVQILTLCVDASYRRKGLALKLLANLADRLVSVDTTCTTSPTPQQSKLRITLHVQSTNTPAISLYQNVGFALAQKKVGHYRGTRYGGADAWEMSKII